jgi:hypothetical protein
MVMQKDLVLIKFFNQKLFLNIIFPNIILLLL